MLRTYNVLNYCINDNTLNMYWFMWELEKNEKGLPIKEDLTYLEKTMAYDIKYIDGFLTIRMTTVSNSHNSSAVSTFLISSNILLLTSHQ